MRTRSRLSGRAGEQDFFVNYGCFSFYVTKNVATGEDGTVIAKTPQDIARIINILFLLLSRLSPSTAMPHGYSVLLKILEFRYRNSTGQILQWQLII